MRGTLAAAMVEEYQHPKEGQRHDGEKPEQREGVEDALRHGWVTPWE